MFEAIIELLLNEVFNESLSNSVGLRVKSVLLDTADTKTINNTNSDVTLITPPGVPGVLNEVVLNTVQDTVSNGENSVVELITASSGENT